MDLQQQWQPHMAPLSIGSQTNGSTIRPASYCGVVGYKPSYGLISRSGVLKQSDKLDHIGYFWKICRRCGAISKVLIKKDLFDHQQFIIPQRNDRCV